MNHATTHRSFAFALLCAAASAQSPDFLLTYSQPELTRSGSAGTVLRFLQPNEIAQIQWLLGPCSSMSAEKWAPRTCFHAMAGDENADGSYWNPAIFGSIDALLTGPILTPAFLGDNQRTVFWSPSVAMGTNISGIPGLRPGDVGRIVPNGPLDGQVQYFMRQEQFNQALGLPPGTPIDIDAIAFSPQFGVFFSLDADTPANTACGPMLVQDGAVVMVPNFALTYTPDMRISTVLPNSAVVLYTEAQMDAFVVNAQVTDRFGACIANAVDTEALDIDYTGPITTYVPCSGLVVFAPTLIFATETMTGASLLTTALGGSIYNTPCGPAGTSCSSGPTFGPQMGIRPTSTTTGAPSHVNALCSTRACRYVLEPQQHVLNAFPTGLPAGSTNIDIASPYAWNFVFVTFVPPTVPSPFPAFPFSMACFPDFYPPNIYYMFTPTVGGFSTFPMFSIPPLTTGKVLFQSLAFVGSSLELSTPAIIDVQ
ncbi:MAG TPA: hypothetical protein VFZ65_14080 [Planctomycetota bacterium]|nr:hypothetical protein [Planctomycetota bacterium]